MIQKNRLALSLALALTAPAVFAAAPKNGDGTHPSHGTSANASPGDTSKQPVRLKAVTVSAALDQARNALSPETGSSQYVIDRTAIAKLPLGAATPINHVLLQAPGVVQDSRGALHVRGDHGNLQYRINGVVIPESISGFGQTLDTRIIHSVKLLDGALPAQYGERTAAVVDITTRNGHALGNGGSAGMTVGSRGTFQPNVSAWGSAGRWSYFGTANYLKSDIGIENPTASRNPIHDRTHQVKGFGDISYLISDHARASLMFGISNSHFQIPDRPGLSPQYVYLNQTAFDSAQLNENQNQVTRFGVFSLQGSLGRTDYQVSLGQRYSTLHFLPDVVGDLMFNGVASSVSRGNRASTLQADFSTPVGDDNTLRYGLYGNLERAASVNDAQVFPADASGAQTSTTPIRIVDGNRLLARTWAAYVQDEWSVNDKLTVNAGLRGDVYKAFRTERQLSPRLGLVYQASDNTVLHAGYARYFTPPSTELISTANIARFDGTTNALPANGDNTPLAQRSDYYDLGISQNIGSAWTLGLDAYYRRVKRLQDEGQFGAALVYSTFNYADGRIKGVEFTANYASGPLSAYFNLAAGKAMGRHVITSQYNFSPADLAYVADHYIFLDHNQTLTSSGGISYDFAGGTTASANYIFGSGLRKDGAVPNGASLPAYFQLDLSLAHDFTFPGTGKLHTRLALINALDRSYELRDGTGIGVGAPQFGPRRGLFLNVQKAF